MHLTPFWQEIVNLPHSSKAHDAREFMHEWVHAYARLYGEPSIFGKLSSHGAMPVGKINDRVAPAMWCAWIARSIDEMPTLHHLGFTERSRKTMLLTLAGCLSYRRAMRALRCGIGTVEREVNGEAPSHLWPDGKPGLVDYAIAMQRVFGNLHRPDTHPATTWHQVAVVQN